MELHKEDAVSPVVGVMLMLVVTIIIAAVVSAFAGGLAGGTKAAPQAAVEVTISTTGGSMSGSEANMDFKLLSGDPIPTKDLAIITYYTLPNGTVIKHEQTAASRLIDHLGYGEASIQARVPFLNDMRYGYAGGDMMAGTVGNPAVDFGNFTWKVGDILSTGGNRGTAELLGINDDSGGFLDAAGFEPGRVVDVKILHVPSSKYIFDKEVVVS